MLLDFGKYKGRELAETPDAYLVWLASTSGRPYIDQALVVAEQRRREQLSGRARRAAQLQQAQLAYEVDIESLNSMLAEAEAEITRVREHAAKRREKVEARWKLAQDAALVEKRMVEKIAAVSRPVPVSEKLASKIAGDRERAGEGLALDREITGERLAREECAREPLTEVERRYDAAMTPHEIDQRRLIQPPFTALMTEAERWRRRRAESDEQRSFREAQT